jgi:uncharacterized phage-like protein YoqJ
MEVQAALEAVTTLDGPLEVVSDSTYVVNCFRDRWWEGWIRRGWLNTAKKPVANRDLWEPLVEAVRADPGRVTFRWVKGHSNDVANDLVDRLAVEAARTQTGRAGVGTPSGLGPADDPSGETGAGRDARLPPGRLVAVVGHKPPELGGYEPNATAERVRERLAEVLAAKGELHPDLTVLTGLGLGAEQLGAEAAAKAGVPYVAVLPFPDPDGKWPESSRRDFRRLLDGATARVVLQSKPPATKQQAGVALRRRDAWIARNADEALAVWDGKDATAGRAVRALEDALGEDEVWVIPVPDHPVAGATGAAGGTGVAAPGGPLPPPPTG